MSKEICQFRPFPIVAVLYLSSPVTRHRFSATLQTWDQYPEIKKYFSFYEMTDKINTTQRYMTQIATRCGFSRSAASCRLEKTLKEYLKFPSVPEWILYLDDDTFVRPDNLFSLINRLQKLVDPSRHIVFKCHSNREFRSIPYVHGGGGFLASKAFVEYMFRRNETLLKYQEYARYRQLDCAISLIVRKMFNRTVDWDEPGFVGYKMNGELLTKDCKFNRRSVSPRDLITLHTIGLSKPSLELFNLSYDQNEKHNLFFDDGDNQAVYLCDRNLTQQTDLSERTPIFTIDDVPDPLYGPNELVDEDGIHYTHYLPEHYYKEGLVNRGTTSPKKALA